MIRSNEKKNCTIFLCSKYIKFCFQNLRNDREDEKGRRQTTFCFDNGKKNSKIFCEIEPFFIFETKCSPSTSVFNFSAIF